MCNIQEHDVSDCSFLRNSAITEAKVNYIGGRNQAGNYKTLSSAVAHIPNREGNKVYNIYVKSGVYHEYVTIGQNHNNVAIIGEGPYKTIFTGDLNVKIKKVDTFKTGTFKVFGESFTARAIGFENSAGPEGHQAVALHVEADMAIFYNCLISGYQDTLSTATHRQFYLECTIEVTVDFIFGYAPVIFQKCRIEIRRPLEGQQCIVTADGRDIDHLDSGIIIQQCSIAPSPRMGFFNHSFESYLGRPWKAFSRTVVMNSEIGDIIHPAGWLKWEL
uniref:Pectinesterase catalytic domain-containing protein n=1 Tax=Kalanchoe fedtschenkoi TaxID=63787 RepID=A0A7N0V094_KALFE